MSGELILQCTISLVIFIIITIYGTLHCFRFHVRKSTTNTNSNTNKWINIKTVSYLIITTTALIRSLRPLILLSAYYGSNHFLNNKTCLVMQRTFISFSILLKFFIHLFIVLRTRITEIDTMTVIETTKTIYYRIGIILSFTDILLFIYVATGIPSIEMNYSLNDGLCRQISISLFVVIWFGLSDIIIGTYCLIVFIYPLPKYIKLQQEEREEKDEENIYNWNINKSVILISIGKRIVLFSSIMIITTMISVIITSIIPPAGNWIFAFDQCINIICIIMQFTPLSRDEISSQKKCAKCLYCINCLQFQFIHDDVKYNENPKAESDGPINTI